MTGIPSARARRVGTAAAAAPPPAEPLAEPTDEEQQVLGSFLADLAPELMGELRTAFENSASGEDFVAFLGYEWHSSRFGDQCVIFADDGRLRVAPADIEAST